RHRLRSGVRLAEGAADGKNTTRARSPATPHREPVDGVVLRPAFQANRAERGERTGPHEDSAYFHNSVAFEFLLLVRSGNEFLQRRQALFESGEFFVPLF